jgi:alpha-tubulin suppressor-like RCC1 family protein
MIASYVHTVALKSDGTVWTWGRGGEGQLGNGVTDDSSSPKQVAGISGVTAVAASTHTLALKSDGTVWAWGANYFGQLGNGTMNMDWSDPVHKVPGQVTGLSGVVAVAAGEGHSVAVKSDGTVWAWGWNQYGQLGNGTQTDSAVPLQVLGLSGMVAVAATDFFTLALANDGTVWGWGDNSGGQLGAPVATKVKPVQVAGISGVVAVAAGPVSSIAVKEDGTVWAWGKNLGNGDPWSVGSLTPVQVSGLSGVVAVSASPTSLTLVLKSDGTVWGWGNNVYFQLGSPYWDHLQLRPVQASYPEGMGWTPVSGVVAIAAGFDGSVALRSDGSVWTWGLNQYGELGRGTKSAYELPAPNGYSYLADACAVVPACSAGACVQPACWGQGTCSSGACACSTGFSGTACDQCAPDFFGYPSCATYCHAETTCHGHGKCDAAGSCSCDAGFASPTCEFGDSTTCHGHGTALATGACSCLTGYTGAGCDQCAPDYYGSSTCTFCDASTTCSGNGTCSPAGSCSCAEGFAGDHCQYSNATLCSGRGVAQRDGTCVCATRYGGASCGECAAGFAVYPGCVESSSLPDAGTGDASSPDAGCAPESDKAICARLHRSCGTGLETDVCGTTRLVSCGGCGVHAVCPAGSCMCAPGFEGDAVAGCTDVDECKVNNGGCLPGAPCVNTPGSHYCEPCPAGFAGPSACKDVDECLVSHGFCDLLTTCTNSPGSWTCGPCPSGHTGTGETGCRDVDECLVNNGGCDPLTTCTNTPGSRTCGACPVGFTGTGESGCHCYDMCAQPGDVCSADGLSVEHCELGANGCISATVMSEAGCDEGSAIDRSWARWPLPDGALPTSRYTLTAETALDNLTGLEWERNQRGGGTGEMYGFWDVAHSYCEGLVLNGKSGWRLPTVIEMLTINDPTVPAFGVNTTVFPDTSQGHLFWSMDTVEANFGLGLQPYGVYVQSGSTALDGVSNKHPYRCVR